MSYFSSLCKYGYAVLRGVISPAELSYLKSETHSLILDKEKAPDDPDYRFFPSSKKNRFLLWKIDYILDKSPACRALAAHPKILDVVKSILGPNFIIAWDSLAVKMAGEGIICNWHRDFPNKYTQLFEVGIYLDDAHRNNCLWLIPGSNNWSGVHIRRKFNQLMRDEDEYSGIHDQTNRFVFPQDAIPIIAKAGDIVIHSLSVLHGSPKTTSRNIRRTVYFGFRPIDMELAIGPHVPEFIPLKQRVLLNCIRYRKTLEITKQEVSYNYQPFSPFHVTIDDAIAQHSYRFEHEKYLRYKD